MSLPRTFVGFSSTDIYSYWLMLGWKAQENIDFDFCNYQLPEAVDSTNEATVKGEILDRLRKSSVYILLIGENTRFKHQYVGWEIRESIRLGHRLIGVNLNHEIGMDHLCPLAFEKVNALFVPFSPHIIAKALRDSPPVQTLATYAGLAYSYAPIDYYLLGYRLDGSKAHWIQKPKPWER